MTSTKASKKARFWLWQGVRLSAHLATVSFIAVIVYIVLLALPIIGMFAYAPLVGYLQDGCRTTAEGFGIDCYRKDVDVGELTAGYVLGIFLGGIMNPWMAYKTVAATVTWPVLFVWPIAASGLHLGASRLKPKPATDVVDQNRNLNSPP